MNYLFSTKHFLNSRYEYPNEWVDVIASQFSINFVHRNDENPIFQLWESETCLISTLNKCRIMFALIYFDMGACFYMFEQKKWKFSKFYIQNIWGKSEAMTSLTHSFAYTWTCIHIDCSRNVSLKITKISKFHSLFFIQFTSSFYDVLFKLFYSFYWINLKLGLEVSFKVKYTYYKSEAKLNSVNSSLR